MNPQILIVEDDVDLLELLEYRLQKNSYDTLGFLSTKSVKQALQEESIDLIIMDRNLPGVEGSEFISMMRAQDLQTPVIFLSAKDSKEDIQEGFLAGGDDYLTKPFEFQELLLRIEAILRRTRPQIEKKVVKFRDIELNSETRTLTIAQKEIEVTKLEFDLLLVLIANKERVLDRDYLLKNVWKNRSDNQGRTVNVAINRLKEKIDPNKDKNYIKTIRGVGYTLV